MHRPCTAPRSCAKPQHVCLAREWQVHCRANQWDFYRWGLPSRLWHSDHRQSSACCERRPTHSSRHTEHTHLLLYINTYRLLYINTPRILFLFFYYEIYILYMWDIRKRTRQEIQINTLPNYITEIFSQFLYLTRANSTKSRSCLHTPKGNFPNFSTWSEPTDNPFPPTLHNITPTTVLQYTWYPIKFFFQIHKCQPQLLILQKVPLLHLP